MKGEEGEERVARGGGGYKESNIDSKRIMRCQQADCVCDTSVSRGQRGMESSHKDAERGVMRRTMGEFISCSVMGGGQNGWWGGCLWELRNVVVHAGQNRRVAGVDGWLHGYNPQTLFHLFLGQVQGSDE